MQLKKQRLLVIGGTSGFGMAIARQALQEGADVHIIGHTAAHVTAAITQLGPSDHLTGMALDAQNLAQLKTFFAAQPAFDHVVSMLGGAMGGGSWTIRLQRFGRRLKINFLQICKWPN